MKKHIYRAVDVKALNLDEFRGDALAGSGKRGRK